MTTQVILGHDVAIATWAFSTFNFEPAQFCMAIGFAAEDKGLISACLFHAYNGHDVEVSYYGKDTLTLPIVRSIARTAVDRLGVSRVTVRTARSNKMLTRGIKKLGFEYEGIRKYGYGDQDAVMFGLFGKNLARLAGKVMH